MSADDEGGARRPGAVDDGLAPVIPLFGGGAGSRGDTAGAWDRTWIDEPAPPAFASRAPSARRATAEDNGPASDAADAEAALLRKLRSRQLSSSEARATLRERGLDDPSIDGIIDAFERRGYLDDARLAEQLSYAAVTRKGQGRRAISLALTARGIARAVADAAIAELPDDDHERAVEFARSKVRRASAVDREAALRRLIGQLTRRGYPSSVAVSAARTALDESL